MPMDMVVQIDELVPSFTAVVDDVVIGCEDAV
jgi:hypothetical protein